MSKYTNRGTVLGGLMWNVNSMTGFALGDPSPEQIRVYSDIVWDTTHDPVHFDYLSGDAINQEFTGYMGGVETPFWGNMPEEEWLKGDWFLFGQTWLPFLAPPPNPNIEGMYLRRRNSQDHTAYNPMRMEVLVPTMMTAGKLSAIVGGAYVTGKLAYKMTRRN